MDAVVSHIPLSKSISDNVQLIVAGSEQQKSQYFRLAHQVYCEKLGWFDPNDSTDDYLTDQFDQFSSHISIWKNNKMAGGFRIVRDSSLGFPHEPIFNLRLPSLCSCIDQSLRNELAGVTRNEMVEVSRFVSNQSTRILTLEVLKTAYWYGLRFGTKAFFIALDINLFLLCHKLGIRAQPIGPAKFVEGSWTIPTIVIYKTMLSRVKAENQDIYQYICDPSNIFEQ